MVEKRVYKIIAAFGAVFSYLFFIFLLVKFIEDSQKAVKDYGYNVEEAIVVELDTKPDKNPVITKKPKPAPVPKKVEPKKEVITPDISEPIEESKQIDEEPKEEPKKEIIKEQKVVEAKEEKPKEQEARDIEAKSAKDLFSTIRSKSYNKVMEEKRKQEAARASRLAKQKAAKRKEEEQKRKRAKALAAAKAILQDIKTSTSTSHKKRGEKDDFWSPISSKIMAKWNRTISTQDGLNATVRIRIDNTGRLTYKIRRLSNNPLFDTKLKVFLENLEYERFPSYKNGSYIEADFVFKDQAN